MLFADAPDAAAEPESLSHRVTRYASGAERFVTTYAPKAERIINAPMYDAAAVLDLDVLWLGGALFALKIVITGMVMEFRKPPAICAICPPVQPSTTEP